MQVTLRQLIIPRTKSEFDTGKYQVTEGLEVNKHQAFGGDWTKEKLSILEGIRERGVTELIEIYKDQLETCFGQ